MIFNESTEAIPARKGQWFPTTHWSVVLAAGQTVSQQSEEALERLCSAYWYPIYAYLRRCGHTQHDAQDLTQEFFARLLDGSSMANVSPAKGKFRSFLLAALNHTMANVREHANAIKRGGGRQIISFDDKAAEEQFQHETQSALSPEQYFEKQWATTLLEKGLARLREEYSAAGKGALFKKLQLFLSNTAASGQYSAAAAELEMNANAVAVAVHRLRHRYRELIRLEIADTVATPDDLEEEMRFLRAALSR